MHKFLTAAQKLLKSPLCVPRMATQCRITVNHTDIVQYKQSTLIASFQGTLVFLSNTHIACIFNDKLAFFKANKTYVLKSSNTTNTFVLRGDSQTCQATLVPKTGLDHLLCTSRFSNIYFRDLLETPDWCEAHGVTQTQFGCLHCHKTFESEASYFTHIEPPIWNYSTGLKPFLDICVTNRMPPFSTFEHGTVAHNGKLNNDFHSKLRNLWRVVAIQAIQQNQQNRSDLD